jgi:hypothetical protein
VVVVFCHSRNGRRATTISILLASECLTVALAISGSGMTSSPTDSLTGAGGTTGAALTAIGSDLSVSLSFQVASELLDAAREEQMSEDELVGIVLGLAVIFSALQSLLRVAVAERHAKLKASAHEEAVRMSKSVQGDDEQHRFRDRCERDAWERASKEKGSLEFVLMLVSIAVRIAFGVSIQLLAASARARQTSRAARVISLVGCSVYFLWLEAGADSRAF